MTRKFKIGKIDKPNRNLTAQAQAIYQSWFVNYEPWGGVCPTDWEETSLSEIAEFIGGYSYKGSELQDSTIAMATIKNFDRKGGLKLDGFKEIQPSAKLKPQQSANLFDLLVAHTDLTQKAEVIGNAEVLLSFGGYEKIVFSMDLVKVLPKSKTPRFVLAAIVKSKQFKEHCLGYVNGTTVLHLSKKALPEFTLLFPRNSESLNELEKALKSIYGTIASNIEENIKLQQLRDILLPKLMSGELDVSKLDI